MTDYTWEETKKRLEEGEKLVQKIRDSGWRYEEYPIRDHHPYNPMLIGWEGEAVKEGTTIKRFRSFRDPLRREMFSVIMGEEALNREINGEKRRDR